VALAGVALYAGCGGDDDSEPEAKTETTSPAPQEDPVETASKHFLDTYVKPDGRVERTDQGGDTVGEGQAYGMLIAAAIGDEQRFDAIWEWTKANIRRPDGLISFLWRDGRVEDPEPASDADVDAVRALLAASCRFDRPELRDEALELADAIMELETVPFEEGPVLVAGPWARKNPITLNPSYFSPATFAQLGDLTGDGRWGSLSASARTISQALMTQGTPLPPDWAQLKGGKPVPSGPPGEPQSTPGYGFDAARTLVRLAEDPDPAGREIAAVAWPVFDGKPPEDIPMEYSLSGEPAGDASHPLALVAAAGAAHAAGDDAAAGTLLDAAEELDQSQPTYYGAAWVALGRIMLTTSDLDACP
jgi:endo-1,4-beta-D-glucanase Y